MPDPDLPLEIVPLASLRPHLRNYRSHPDEQLAHIRYSLQTYGVYRNVVIAREGTLLAGHGVVDAARSLGWTHLPVYRMDLDPYDDAALKILVGDNEQARLGPSDEGALAELKRICAFPDDFVLTGTYAQQWERLGNSVPPVMMFHIARAVYTGIFAQGTA